MPKLVCVRCHCELKPQTNGTVVIETASFGVYKVWAADTLKCPGCGVELVAGFGQKPLRDDHWADDFPKWLDEIMESGTRIEYDNECPMSSV